MSIRDVAIATVGLAVCFTVVGCGGEKEDKPQTCTSTPEFATLFPTDNEVAGWTVQAGTAFMTTNSSTEIDNLIDGAAEPYIQMGFVVWGERQYTDGAHPLKMDLYQVAGVTKNQQIWDAELASGSTYTHWTNVTGWTNVSDLGDAARMANIGDNLVMYGARKCAYQLEASATKQTGDGTIDAATRTAVETFLKAVLNKIPK